MGHANKVMKSINNPQQDRCVDIFMSPDGTFGFGEFRRDVETGEGWFPVGMHAAPVYPDFDAAMAEALANVSWLFESLTKELKKN